MMRMTFRMLLWVYVALNKLFALLFLDLFWSGVDDDRQTLCDRFAGTCVVKSASEPSGSAEIHLAYYTACGFVFVYPRVMRPKHIELSK